MLKIKMQVWYDFCGDTGACSLAEEESEWVYNDDDLFAEIDKLGEEMRARVKRFKETGA
jgi:hypothetical protein